MRLMIGNARNMRVEMGRTAAVMSRALLGRGGRALESGAAPELVRSAVVDGIVMRWEEHGTDGGGLPVVLVHGIPTHPRLFRYVIPRVADGASRCYAWELVGFGASMSEGLRRDISVARQAEYLAAWMEHVGIERAVLVGHDLGGGVVQRLAVAHPRRCAGLVLADSAAYDNWPVPAVRAARALSGTIERLPPALMKPALFAGMINLGHDNNVRLSESIELHWRHYAAPVGPAAYAHQLRSLDNRDTMAVAGDLGNLSVPARIVWGDRDPLGLASAERLAGELRAPLRRIPGARHFTPEDHPDVIADAIRAVLAEDAALSAPH